MVSTMQPLANVDLTVPYPFLKIFRGKKAAAGFKKQIDEEGEFDSRFGSNQD